VWNRGKERAGEGKRKVNVQKGCRGRLGENEGWMKKERGEGETFINNANVQRK
jgi:hypothetical protein